MTIGIMVLDLYSQESHSLKEKRKILLSVKDRLRHKFNISLIESDHQDLWQKIQLTMAVVANTKEIADKTFTQIEDFIISQYSVQILKMDKEFI
jgi:uncharacterized protein YlxP (DUF503 family)